MLPEVFLVRAYQESERWEGGNEGFMCKAHQKNPRPAPTVSLAHFVPRAFHSHSPYFKQEVLHSILRGYFKNFLLGAPLVHCNPRITSQLQFLLSHFYTSWCGEWTEIFLNRKRGFFRLMFTAKSSRLLSVRRGFKHEAVVLLWAFLREIKNGELQVESETAE